MVNYFALRPCCNSVDDATLRHQEAVQQHARVDEHRSSEAGYSDQDWLNTKDTTLMVLITNTEPFMLVIDSTIAETVRDYSSAATLDCREKLSHTYRQMKKTL